MVVWLSMLGFIILTGGIIGTLDTPKKKKQFLIISALIVIFVMGSRDAFSNSGSDLNNYYRLFGRANNMDWGKYLASTKMEMGYIYLNKFLAMIVPWQQFILYFQAAFCVGFICYFIYKNTEDVFLGMIFFICLGTMQFFLTGFRQSIAIVLCLFAFEFAKRKKMFRFIIIILIASTIHQTAIVFLPMYYFVGRKATGINNLILCVFMAVALLFVNKFMDFGNSVFDKQYDLQYSGNVFGGIAPIIIYVMSIWLINITFSKKDWSSDIEKYSPLINLMFIGTGIYIMRYQALVMERISFYFTPAVIALLPSAIIRQNGRQSRTLLYFFSITLSIIIFIWRLSSSIGTHYVFFWGQ